jgi:hypothetical protein
VLSFRDRILAKIDQILTWNFEGPTRESDNLVDFYPGCGRKMVILNERGMPRIIGGSFWVEHGYDDKGKLIRRAKVRNTAKEGEKVIYGTKAVNDAYLAYYQKYYPNLVKKRP